MIAISSSVEHTHPAFTAFVRFLLTSYSCSAAFCCVSRARLRVCWLLVLSIFPREALANGASGATDMSISVGWRRTIDTVSDDSVGSLCSLYPESVGNGFR